MKTIYLAVCLLLQACASYAAVGCDLNDPDRDIARLFPGSSGYKTAYLSIKTSGGPELLKRVETRLGDTFHGLYEDIDVPYTLYTVQKNAKTVGYVHGVNQKGDYGGIQVFLALDSSGTVKSFYIQKLTSRAAKQLRAKQFAVQFEGLKLEDFADYSPADGKIPAQGPLAKISNPAPDAGNDFRAVLRAVKKNLVLMDEFVFSKRAK